MPPRMRTRSAGQPAAESLRGGTGVQVGRGGRGRRPREGNDERVDNLNGQGNDQGMGANGGVEGVNGNVKGANGGAPDFSTIIAQQLQNLLPVMLAQVSNRGNVGNQNGNVVNENVLREDQNIINGKTMTNLSTNSWKNSVLKSNKYSWSIREDKRHKRINNDLTCAKSSLGRFHALLIATDGSHAIRRPFGDRLQLRGISSMLTQRRNGRSRVMNVAENFTGQRSVKNITRRELRQSARLGDASGFLSAMTRELATSAFSCSPREDDQLECEYLQKKTRKTQAKMTKTGMGMEKRLLQNQAKVQKMSKVRVNTEDQQ
ncbi:hypothetical protein Tco_1079877 [Tanacetum coccineum]|uniref:Uncharacterized protein n=1 Tax=Tanacetum coccineum TaxID=301880 RepID=A0ABQ5HUT2_9ASTR